MSKKKFFMVVSILTALIKKKWMMLFSVSLLFMFILTCWCGNSIRLVGCNFHKKVPRRDFFVSDAFSTFILPQMMNGSTILTIQLFKVCFICQTFMRKHESQEISFVYFIYRHIVCITMARPKYSLFYICIELYRLILAPFLYSKMTLISNKLSIVSLNLIGTALALVIMAKILTFFHLKVLKLWSRNFGT